jgi:hypothetical protein
LAAALLDTRKCHTGRSKRQEPRDGRLKLKRNRRA